MNKHVSSERKADLTNEALIIRGNWNTGFLDYILP